MVKKFIALLIFLGVVFWAYRSEEESSSLSPGKTIAMRSEKISLLSPQAPKKSSGPHRLPAQASSLVESMLIQNIPELQVLPARESKEVEGKVAPVFSSGRKKYQWREDYVAIAKKHLDPSLLAHVVGSKGSYYLVPAEFVPQNVLYKQVVQNQETQRLGIVSGAIKLMGHNQSIRPEELVDLEVLKEYEHLNAYLVRPHEAGSLSSTYEKLKSSGHFAFVEIEVTDYFHLAN